MIARLKDKVAVVVGGGSWIGKEIAKRYAREGAIVFIAGKTLAKLEQVVNEISEEGGVATCTLIDVRDENQVSDFFKQIEISHKKIDILINSAAIYPRSTIDSLSLKEWREVIDVNLTGAFIVLKHAAEIMKKHSQGKIIFISSVAGEKLGVSGFTHYGASKAGMNGLMRSAAVELASYGINVNSIDPGNIVNKKRFNIDDIGMKEMIKSIPIGRTGQPQDVANLALFLASDDSSFITGQDYVIDGGEIIQ
ncbi:MAG: SDR family NAD(P)-dependent oxidoreductase [Gammaproteobacteria bacterium]